MMRHYVDETDEELRQASNRTYRRLIAGLSLEVANRYGFNGDEEGFDLEERLKAAVAAKDWKQAGKILKELSSQG